MRVRSVTYYVLTLYPLTHALSRPLPLSVCCLLRHRRLPSRGDMSALTPQSSTALPFKACPLALQDELGVGQTESGSGGREGVREVREYADDDLGQAVASAIRNTF